MKYNFNTEKWSRGDDIVCGCFLCAILLVEIACILDGLGIIPTLLK